MRTVAVGSGHGAPRVWSPGPGGSELASAYQDSEEDTSVVYNFHFVSRVCITKHCMMRLLHSVLLFSLYYLGVAQETTSDDLTLKTNTVESSPSVRLDPYIRKALLKALSDLEDSENFSDFESTAGTSTSDIENVTTNDEVTVSQANKENIQIHSFVVNGQAAFSNSSQTSPTLLDNNISILSTTVGNVENYVTANLPTQAPFDEIFQTRESGVNLQQIRSIPSTKSNAVNLAHSKLTTSKPRISTTTTSTTTTTTTPKPTHNEDGENIEEVDKKDVQVFQAPLVAAFTVHQDAQGIPKQVIPIFQQTNNQESLKASPTVKTPVVPNIPQPTEFINQQLTLQKQLEEKQRILEQQLRLLQIQQIQQEQLLRNQQLLLQQKEAQRIRFEQEQFKRQQLLVEQQKLSSNQFVNSFQVQKNIGQNQILSQNSAIPQKPQVSILPSVTLDQTNTLAPQQQLPNKEAVDFLIHLRGQQQNQFPLQENHLPQGISNILQPNSVQNFNQGQSLKRPSIDQLRQKQGNRVFRHESGVGNLGINSQNYNRFNTFDTPFSNQFLPTNTFNQFSPDAELKQLLAQSSLNTRTHEDLNIVSKVLSLNHGIPVNNISNRLTFDSRRHVRRTS